MVKKKSSKKKVNYNNKTIALGVIVLVILFVLAFTYQGSRDDEEGLGTFFGMDNDLEDDGDDDYNIDSDNKIPCDEFGEPVGCEFKAGPTCKFPSTWCGASKGNAKACCPEGSSCKKYKYAAWCSPDKKEQCEEPRTHFCSSKKDNVCCLRSPKEKCAKKHGYAWCKPNGNECAKRFKGNGLLCEFYCCDKRYQKCSGNGFFAPDSCTVFAGGICPGGRVKCEGKANGYESIKCCNPGTCISSTTGPPTCSDNDYLK